MKNYFKIIILLFIIPFLYACGSSGYATPSYSASSSNSYIDSSEKEAGNASIFGSPGVTYQQIGDFTYGSDGTSYQNIGNFTYGSDGTSYQQIGDFTYGSDGTSYQQIGNFNYGSDGTTCQTIGTFTYCN